MTYSSVCSVPGVQSTKQLPNNLFVLLIQLAPGSFKLLLSIFLKGCEVEITLLQVSLISGTGSLGREFWKLYSIGFLPEKTFTSN